jgi:hypothetical protein
MKDSQDWLDELLDNYGNWIAYCENPVNYGHTPPRSGRITDAQAKSAIREHFLKEALELIDEVGTYYVGDWPACNPDELRNKFNDKYKED